MNTDDLKLYEVDGQWKAEIDVHITHEKGCTSIKECRHAVLQIKSGGYVVYDRPLMQNCEWRFLGKEVESALEVARLYNQGHGNPDMSPNGLALGLIYPSSQE